MQPSTVPLTAANILESASGPQNHTDIHIQSVSRTEDDSRSREETILTVGDQSVQVPEYAETAGSNGLRYLASIELKEREAPNYFNPIRPDSLENKISNTAFHQRITKLNQQIAKIRPTQYLYDTLITICWLALPSCIIVDLAVPLPKSIQIVLFLVAVACIILRFVFANLMPTISSLCDRAIESWVEEDSYLNGNLAYEKTELIFGISIYERVDAAQAGITDLPLYEK